MLKRVLIADGNAAMCGFIRSVLEGLAGLEVCGEAVDGVDAVLKGSELHSNLAILAQ